MEKTEPLLGEAKAAWLAIKKAADEGFMRIILEGDALNVIEPLKNKAIVSHWRIKAVLEDILFLVKYFDNVSFSFICKERNLTVQPSSPVGCSFELDWTSSHLYLVVVVSSSFR